MSTRNRWGALVFALMLPLGACGDEPADERAALEDEELQRELELALKGDTVLTTFEDTVVGVEPTPEREETPVQPRQTPTPQPAPSRPRASQPERRPEPRQPVTRPEPPPPAPREEAPAPRSIRRSLPVGTTFAIRLNETLSTETNQPGDGFTATVSEPIYAADGSLLIPSGARIRGRVTSVDQSDRIGETAMIKVAFESISFGDGSYPLSASVVEANPERVTRTSKKEQAAKIAAGAAAGAILGQVLGRDTESTLKGAAAGAVAGTAIAMGTADVDAVLPQGSRMVIRLDAPIEVVQRIS